LGVTRLKVVHLTSVHSALDVRIFYKECRTLAAAGFDVVLIAATERDRVEDGVQIRAVPKPNSRSARMTRTTRQILRVAWRERADVYHFHDPELIPVGVLLALCGRRVIYDVHEDLPRQISGKHWIRGWMRWPVSRAAAVLEALGSLVFRGIVAATPTIAARFPVRKTVTVQNFPVVGELAVSNWRTLADRPPHAAYIGGIDVGRGIREIVASLALVRESLNARLVLAGKVDPPELLDSLRRIPGWDKVDFRGWLSRKDIAELLANVRVGLVVLHPEPNYLDSYPIKLFEYMAVGLPVVVSTFPLWRQIVEGSGCGLVVDPMDPASISQAIQWLVENTAEAEAMGERGRRAIVAKYNWATEAEKLKLCYRNLGREGEQF